jgi:hypothetical protein
MTVAALVKQGGETTSPLNPEYTIKEEESGKRGCEWEAGKWWLSDNAERYRWLNPVFLEMIYTQITLYSNIEPADAFSIYVQT